MIVKPTFAVCFHKYLLSDTMKHNRPTYLTYLHLLTLSLRESVSVCVGVPITSQNNLIMHATNITSEFAPLTFIAKSTISCRTYKEIACLSLCHLYTALQSLDRLHSLLEGHDR